MYLSEDHVIRRISVRVILNIPFVLSQSVYCVHIFPIAQCCVIAEFCFARCIRIVTLAYVNTESYLYETPEDIGNPHKWQFLFVVSPAILQ